MWRWTLLLLALLSLGCAAAAPPPQATQIPYSPTLLTVDRAAAANDYKADVATRENVDTFVAKMAAKAGCDPTWWTGVNDAWSKRQDRQWTILWTFQPITNAPAANPTLDIISALAGAAVKVAPLLMLKAPLPPC